MQNQNLMPETRMSQVADVLSSRLGKDTVMMDIERGLYYGLNVTASRIWALLAEPMTISDLCDQLAHEFAVPRSQCEQDVFTFLEALMARGLVKAER